MSDYELLKCIVLDRQDSLTNMYSPLYQKLNKLYGQLKNREELTKH